VETASDVMSNKELGLEKHTLRTQNHFTFNRYRHCRLTALDSHQKPFLFH